MNKEDKKEGKNIDITRRETLVFFTVRLFCFSQRRLFFSFFFSSFFFSV